MVSTLADFSRKRVRIQAMGKDVASPGEVITLTLPEGKILADTITLGGYVQAEGAGAAGASLPNIEQLIEGISVQVGNVELHPGLQNWYGLIWGIHADYQGVWAKAPVRQILNTMPVVGTAPSANINPPIPFQCSLWLGFLQDAKVLYTDRMPPVRITIRLARPNVLAVAAAATDAAYQLSKLVFTMDMIKTSPVLDELLSQKIASSPLQIPYTNYAVQPGNIGGLTQTTRFSTTSDCVEKVFGTFIPATYQNAKQVINPNTYLSHAFTRGGSNLHLGLQSRFEFNGSSHPDVAAEVPEQLISTLDALNETHDITSQPHPNLKTLAAYGQDFYCHGVSLTYDADGGLDAANRKCGISALGMNLQGSYETRATAGQTTSNLLPLVIIQSKSVLEISSGRSARVIL